MPKLPRKNQKVFATSAGGTQRGVFGSLAAGAPAYSTDPETIQSLSNFEGGWYSAVVGGNSPAIQDMNALCFVFAYQLAYLFQQGVPEWNALTTYYIGSYASDGLGNVYVSRTNDNLNNVLTNSTHWQKVFGTNTVASYSGTNTIPENVSLARVSGAGTKTLPDATKMPGGIVTVKKTDTGTTTPLAFQGGQSADGQTSFSMSEQYGFYQFQSNGTNFDIIAWG